MSFRVERLHKMRSQFTRTLGQVVNEISFRELHLQFGMLDRPEFFRISELFISAMVPVPKLGHYRSADVDLRLQANIRNYRDIVRDKSEQLKTAALMYPEHAGASSNRAVQCVRLERACLKRCKTEQDAEYRLMMCLEGLGIRLRG